MQVENVGWEGEMFQIVGWEEEIAISPKRFPERAGFCRSGRENWQGTCISPRRIRELLGGGTSVYLILVATLSSVSGTWCMVQSLGEKNAKISVDVHYYLTASNVAIILYRTYKK